MRWTSLLLAGVAACSIVESADDIVVGDGAAIDAGSDAPLPVDAAIADAGSDRGASADDPRWALWRMPSITPTDYGQGATPEVVIDHLTGLSWQKTAQGPGTFDQASADCAALDLDGKGWRLPTRVELVSLLAFGRGVIPAIDQSAFPSTPASPFWTSSTLASGGRYAIDFDAGTVSAAAGSEPYYHRCVRAP